MAALAPIPNASVTTTVAVSPLARTSERTACFSSPKKSLTASATCKCLAWLSVMVLAPPQSAGPARDWPSILYRTAGREIDTPGCFFGCWQECRRRVNICDKCLLVALLRLSKQITQPVKAAFPHRVAIGEPLLRHGKAAGSEAASAYPADLFGLYEAAFLQHLQVLDDRSQRDGEGLRQPRNRYWSLAEFLQNCPARGIAERVEDAVDIGLLPMHWPAP